MDFSIPPFVSSATAEKLSQLIADFHEGYLTEKGYIKNRETVLTGITGHTRQSSRVVSEAPTSPSSMVDLNQETIQTDIVSGSVEASSEQHYSLYSNHGVVVDPMADLYDKSKVRVELQKPLDPRELAENSSFEKLDNLPSILRMRGSTYQKETAIITIDPRGRENSSITWEKLYLKSEKVAQQIRDKSRLYRGDRVCIVYHNSEIIDFTVAMCGCFLAGVVAVPVSSNLPVKEFIKILNETQSHLCLISEFVSKQHERLKIAWPKGVEIWKTSDMGMYQPPSRHADPPALKVPDLAYIEYSKSPTGEIRGVVLSHRTIMHQMSCMTSILSSRPNSEPLRRSEMAFTRSKHVILSTLDARESMGLILGPLFTVYSGNPLVWVAPSSMEVPGLYANVITKYKVSVLVADYLGLKQVTFNYQSFPQLTRTFNKKVAVDLSCVQWCLINALTVDCEFHELLTDRWFRPLGCKNSREVVSPMLCLSEYGGMVISMRDWLGNEMKLGCTFHKPLNMDEEVQAETSSDLSQVLIERDSLNTNSVKVVSDRPPRNPSDIDRDSSKFILVGAFGFPLPDATLAVVNPETNMLSRSMEVGEIWIDSPCISGGFWGLIKETDTIFHARCRDYQGILDLEFLRTGLLGFTYNGKIYVLGLYEDRLRQRSRQENVPLTEYTYHYASHLVRTLARSIPMVSECSFFDIFINREYLPVVVIETPAAKPALLTQGASSLQLDHGMLDEIASKAIATLERFHGVRVYCVALAPPESLPRTVRSGRSEIANMLCKRRFNEGSLPCKYVKFNMLSSLGNIARGKDIEGGIWSEYSSKARGSSLSYAESQYSGLDYREVAVDDRTRAPLTDFKTIVDIFKWRTGNQPDELAFAVLDRSNKETKPLTWKKLHQRVSAMCQYIMEKSLLKPGAHAILMYTLSEEFIVSLYACFITGIVVISLAPVDQSRLAEDAASFVGVIKDFDVKSIFVNSEVESTLKSKPFSNAIKSVDKYFVVPKIRNSAKHTKSSLSAGALNSKVANFQAATNFRNESTTCLIWIQWTSDHYRIGTRLTHKIVMGMCKIVKETCQMTSTNPLIGCVRHVSGLGFLQSCLLGPFIGCATYLYTPLEFAQYPLNFFIALSRNKVKDTYVTRQMLKHAMGKFKPKNFELLELKNIMISAKDRPDVELVQSVKIHFSPTELSSSSLSFVYSHDFNPFITSRSYLSFDPIDLWLDPVALRQGYVSLVNPKSNPAAIHVQDSGMVPVCTQIAIVNPQTEQLCKIGEFGEIWVCSEGNAYSFTNGPKGPLDPFIESQFNAKIKGGNPDMSYLRTGDLGFLHTVSKSVSRDGGYVDMQPLFVLGKISETIEVLGLHHFPIDLESSVEKLSDVYKNGCCIFKCGDFTVVVVEPKRSSNLASLVPVIVNTLLTKHQLPVDTVGFVKKGEFPLSRLGEKQRARIVDAYVNGSLSLVAHYGVNTGENSLVELVKDGGREP